MVGEGPDGDGVSRAAPLEGSSNSARQLEGHAMPAFVRRAATALALGLISSALPWAVVPAHAVTVTTCPSNQAELVAAMTAAGSGGTVQFSCDAPITPATRITLPSVTIDGNSHDVTISGGNAVQILYVPSNSKVTLNGLNVVSGNSGALIGGAIYVSSAVLSPSPTAPWPTAREVLVAR